MKPAKKITPKYGSLQSPIKIDGLPAIHCFITEKNKRVVDIHSLQKALGYDGKSELWLLNLLITLSKFEEVPEKILHAYNHPKNIEITHKSVESVELTVVDYKICQATLTLIVTAKNEGLLSASQIKYAKNAEIILKQISSVGLKKIINQASGLTLLKDRNKAYIQSLLIEKHPNDALLWTKCLPNSFFEKVLQLERLTWQELEKSPDKTTNIFYQLLLVHTPEELYLKMTSEKPKRIYQKKYNKPKKQVFPELQAYLNDLILLIDQSAGDRFIFNQLLIRKFPAKTLAESPKTIPKTTVDLSRFNLVLQKIIQ